MNYWFMVFFFVAFNSTCMSPDDTDDKRLQTGLAFLNTAKQIDPKKIVDAQILCLCALEEFITTPSNGYLNEAIDLYNKLQKKVRKKTYFRKKTYSKKQLLSKKKLIISIQSKSYAAIQKVDSPLFDVIAFCTLVNKLYNLEIPPSYEACQKLSIRLIES